MKLAALWLGLMLVLITAVVLAVRNFAPAAAAARQLVSPGPLTPGHATLSNQCSACHEPAVGVTVAKCTVCHANAERLLGRQPTAFHASVQECSTCHIEHQSTNIRPVLMDHVALAQIGARTLASATRGDPDSAATLQSLETWLRIRSPEQLDAGTAREALNCAGCHDSKDPHFKRFGNDCAQCHAFAQALASRPAAAPARVRCWLRASA